MTKETPGPSGDGTGPIGRIRSLLDSFAAITDGDGDGVTRLAYTQRERTAHATYATFMRDLGLKVWTDEAGNTVAERPGRDELAPIATGSHLDTVPAGGRFDGTAGVVAAMETAWALVQADVQHRHPLRFIAFAAEEGARFGQACLGSRFAAGLMTGDDLERRDAAGMSLSEAMRSVGLDPARALSQRPPGLAAFVELHVEQGGILETTGTQVGVVDLVSGSTRITLEVTGRPSHSGATPMELRADALTAAAEIVLAVEATTREPAHRGVRATVGRLSVEPSSITTIPGRVALSVDVRDVDSDRQRAVALQIITTARLVGQQRSTPVSVSVIGDTSPVILPVWLRRLAVQACQDQGVSFRVMASGASHDAQVMQSSVPSAIIFVPSVAGLSHVPQEWTSLPDLAVGAAVLRTCLLRIDAGAREPPLAGPAEPGETGERSR